jgi:hypothetical protein
METQASSSSDTAKHSQAKNLTCWHTATSPQCLRVETTSEIHLFVYGYFRQAKFSRQGNKDTVEILFQDQIVIVKGKNLESLCDALARLAVERINLCPEKYSMISRNEGVVETIEIKFETKKVPHNLPQT